MKEVFKVVFRTIVVGIVVCNFYGQQLGWFARDAVENTLMGVTAIGMYVFPISFALLTIAHIMRESKAKKLMGEAVEEAMKDFVSKSGDFQSQAKASVQNFMDRKKKGEKKGENEADGSAASPA